MANKPKQMGTEHESKIKAWLREHGWPYADRRTQNGAADLGDLVLSERIPFIIEAKTAKKPGRPIFNDMLLQIERGAADGILAWHPDRNREQPNFDSFSLLVRLI